MKISPTGAEFLHADGQTGGHDEANSRFLQFCGRAQKMFVGIFREVSSSFLA